MKAPYVSRYSPKTLRKRSEISPIVVNCEGVVTEVKTMSGHPIFEADVVEALKGWRFNRSDREHALQVTCIFEFNGL